MHFPAQSIKKVQSKLTESQQRDFEILKEHTNRLWRNFWIKVMKTQGYSNVEIAKEFGLSEGTIRNILKK